MTLSYRIQDINYRTGDFEVVITLNGSEALCKFDLRIINSRAFVSDKINAASVKCRAAASFTFSFCMKEKPKEISQEIYKSLIKAKEKYERIEANKRENTYGVRQ